VDGGGSARFRPVFSVSAKFRFRAFSTARPHTANVVSYFFNNLGGCATNIDDFNKNRNLINLAYSISVLFSYSQRQEPLN
jgi:hypothetical protein